MYNMPSSKSLRKDFLKFNAEDYLANRVEYSFKIDAYEDQIEFSKS